MRLLLLISMGLVFENANTTSVCYYTDYYSYLYGPTGVISSPNYPSPYNHDTNCCSYISVSSGHSLIITFLAFDTEASHDRLTISCYSGENYNSTYSGSELPAVLKISLCSYVKVSFVTDSSVTKTGFSFTYFVMQVTVCENRHFSGPSGTISSPNHPNNYANNLDCSSYISPSSAQAVIISFSVFRTQSVNDWVKVSCESGTSFTTPSYSGSQTPANLTISSCNLVKVYFHTDSELVYTGFSLTYTIVPDCGSSNFYEPSGQISSPKFPLAYRNYLDCSTYIIIPSDEHVVITFLAFNIESSCGWVTITCASGKTFESPRISGSQIPAVLTISSCYRVKVSFHTECSDSNRGFTLAYNVTSDIIIGGFTTKPSNAFPRSDKNEPVIFNCTTSTGYLPWWTFSDQSSINHTITNSACEIITSAPHSSWFMTETVGPGSCNLIVIAPANVLYLLAGSFVCTDSTLALARAILAPINLGVIYSSTSAVDIIRDGEIRVSCSPSFAYSHSSSSPVFNYFLYNGGPFVQVRIRTTHWTSQGKVVSSTNASSTSSYVIVKASVGFIPHYACNVVCDFFSNISDITVNSTIELSFGVDPFNFEDLYATYQNLKLQVFILGLMLGASILTILIVLAVLLGRKFRHQKRNTGVGHEVDANELELREKEGDENVYQNDVGKAADVDESEYDNLDATRRRLAAEPDVYQALQLKK